MKTKDLMSKVVTVQQEYVRNLNPITQEIEWIILEAINPRAGWIVGQRSLQEGKRVFIDKEVGYVFEQSGRIPCILVVYWPTMKPVRVPLDGYLVTSISPYPPNGSPEERQ